MATDPQLRESLLEIARELEAIVVSLDRIGSHYAKSERRELEAALASYVIDGDVFRRLAKARRILFDTLADNEESESRDRLERELGQITYWSPNDD